MKPISIFVAKRVSASVALLGLLAMPLTSDAWEYTLTNGNATATIHPDTDAGMSGFTVDGQTQLYKQSFFYRAGGMYQEQSISTLSSVTTLNGPDSLTSLYSGSGFSIEANYSLLGGLPGSGGAAVTEQVKISNLTSSALTFHFFQYVDFDLGGNWLGDTVTLEQNLQGKFVRAIQQKGNFYFADEVISPAADHGEVGLSQSILTQLLDSSPTTLSGNTGPVTGDAVWAFQWDMTIPANGWYNLAINKSVYLAPEPASLTLVGAGIAAVFAIRRRISRSK